MNDYENFIHEYYAPFLSSNNHEDVSSGSDYDSAKLIVFRNKNIILDLLLNKSDSFEWRLSLISFILYDKKLSSYMDHISEHINSSNQKIHSYDKMRIFFNLGSKKCKNNNNSTCQLNHPQNLLINFSERIFLLLF